MNVSAQFMNIAKFCCPIKYPIAKIKFTFRCTTDQAGRKTCLLTSLLFNFSSSLRNTPKNFRNPHYTLEPPPLSSFIETLFHYLLSKETYPFKEYIALPFLIYTMIQTVPSSSTCCSTCISIFSVDTFFSANFLRNSV